MPGYKQWAIGDDFPPVDIDSYLMGQTVMRFPNAATRAGQLPTPVDGMLSYLTDTGLTYQALGGQWVPSFQYIKKSATQSVVSSTTLVDDADLFATLVPGTYRIEAKLHVAGATAGDIMVSWSFSGTITGVGNRAVIGMAVAGTDGTTATNIRTSAHSLTTSVNYGVELGTTGIHEDILLVVATAGVLKLRWAQNTSSTTATTMSGASRLYITKMS